MLARRVLARLAAAAGALLAMPLYAASGWARRLPDHVVFGGNGDRFSDNAKHLFLAMADDDRFRCVWVTGRRDVRDAVRAAGCLAELRWSWRGVRETLRARWFVFGAYPSDVNFWTSRGATLVNLWHGVPFKAIEFDVDTGPLARLYRSPRWSPLRLAFLDRFVRPDLVVSPSRLLTERCFTSAFRIPAERCVEVGYPRNDRLFAADARDAATAASGVAAKVGPRRQVVGYFPTWRDDGRDFLRDAGFSFDAMEERLAAAGRLLVFKAHPNFAGLAPASSAWPHVEILDPRVDLAEVLALCDVLVTDYSSAAFDFLLLDRPIVYFLPDHDRYVGARNLYFSVEEMTAGPVVTRVEELYDLLAGELVDRHADERAALRRLVWGDYSGGASAALVELIAEAANAEAASSSRRREPAGAGRRPQ